MIVKKKKSAQINITGMKTYDLYVAPTEFQEHILTLYVGSLHFIGQSVCL